MTLTTRSIRYLGLGCSFLGNTSGNFILYCLYQYRNYCTAIFFYISLIFLHQFSQIITDLSGRVSPMRRSKLDHQHQLGYFRSTSLKGVSVVGTLFARILAYNVWLGWISGLLGWICHATLVPIFPYNLALLLH